jgi:hypothetical protein
MEFPHAFHELQSSYVLNEYPSDLHEVCTLFSHALAEVKRQVKKVFLVTGAENETASLQPPGASGGVEAEVASTTHPISVTGAGAELSEAISSGGEDGDVGVGAGAGAGRGSTAVEGSDSNITTSALATSTASERLDYLMGDAAVHGAGLSQLHESMLARIAGIECSIEDTVQELVREMACTMQYLPVSLVTTAVRDPVTGFIDTSDLMMKTLRWTQVFWSRLL